MQKMKEKVTFTEKQFVLPTDKIKSICHIYKWKEVSERRLKLTTFLLVASMVSNIMTFSLGGSIVISITTPPEDPSCFYPVPESTASSITPFILNQLAVAVMYPIVGWLADTVIGRGVAINIGLWCNWFGSVLYIVSYCIQYGFCGGLPVNIAKYGISALAIILITFGNTNSLANILPYGQDQLVNRSSNQIRAFIHWVIWGLHLGYIFDFEYFYPSIIYEPVLILTIGMIILFFNSIVLILFGSFDYKFKPSGVLKKNPYKSVYKVLKYAVQHKSPTNRSAMTYWEHTAPSRIDLGMKKYGGPFTEDEVEDVKVFWRIFGIIASSFGLHFPMYVTILGILDFVQTFYGAENNFIGSYFFWSFFYKSILVIVPVMQFIVIPLVPKIDYFLVKSLRNIGALYVLMIISMLPLVIITIVGKGLPFASIPTVNLPYYWFAIPLFLTGLVESFRLIFTLEFIISQAPANMSGMLMALFWSLQATFISLGSLVKLPFVYSNTDGSENLSNNFWVFSINLLVLIVGFVVYIVCAWKYKRRQRDDGYYYQNVIEDTYGRILDREAAEMIINGKSQTIKISDNSI